MLLKFDETDLLAQAASAITWATTAAPTTLADEPFFDPALPLPAYPPIPPPEHAPPPFDELLALLPDSYATKMELAYQQMSAFAALWWPPLLPLIDVQPFFEWALQLDRSGPATTSYTNSAWRPSGTCCATSISEGTPYSTGASPRSASSRLSLRTRGTSSVWLGGWRRCFTIAVIPISTTEAWRIGWPSRMGFPLRALRTWPGTRITSISPIFWEA